MKILLATFFQIPYVGGLWKYMLQVKQGLELEGHQVDLFGNGLDRFYIFNSNQEVPKVHFKEMFDYKITPATAPLIAEHPWVREAETDRYCMELSLAFIGLDQYDIIHAQDVLAAAAIKRIKPGQIPLVTSIHASAALTVLDMLENNKTSSEDPTSSLVWKYYKSMEYLGSSVSDKVLLASEWLKEVMVHQFRAPSDRIALIPYAIDIPFFQSSMRKVSGNPIVKPKDKTVIISTSRLSYEKGIHILLNALCRLYVDRQDWECWLVGDGDKRYEYEELCRQMGIQSAVRFLGSREDVPYLLSQAEIFAMPSLMETLSYSVMEAQLAGLPIVSSSAGGLKEAVRHNVDGLLSPPGDAHVLYLYLGQLLSDSSFRRRLGDNALEWALKNRSLQTMIKHLTGVYSEQLSLKKQS